MRSDENEFSIMYSYQKHNIKLFTYTTLHNLYTYIQIK
jgi:hypothetical protein